MRAPVIRPAPFLAAAAALFAACATDPARQEGFVTTEDGSRIRFVLLGEGDQVVMIPMAEYLAEPLAPLAEGRRLLFYDPRSRGPSDRAEAGTATEDREIRDMETLRMAFAIDSMALLGWSGLGKQVAVYAIRHPERVTRIVQVAPVPPSSETYPAEPDAPPREERMDVAAIGALDARWRSGGFEGDGAAYCRARRALTQPASFADTALWQLAPDVCRYENEWPHNLSTYFGELLPSFGRFDWRDSIRDVGIPRLVVHGREDGIPLSGARAWVEGDSAARLLVLSPAGHWPFLEQPGAFFSAVDTFLEGRLPPEAEAVPAVVEPQRIGLLELPGLFGLPDPAGPPGSRLPSELRPVPLHARPDAASPVIARVSSGDSLRWHELSEGVPAALAYGRTGEWVLVALREGEARYGWVPPDHTGALHDLGTLLKEGLSYLTRDWDGLLRDAPSLAAATREARPPGTAESMDINVVRVVESEGTTWLHIEVLEPGRCATGRGVPVLATGWVPALGEPDVPNAWFYSRGC